MKWEGDKRFLKNYRQPSWPEANLSWVMDYATNNADKNDVVFLGFSTCVYGVKPRQFEQATGLRAFSLSCARHITAEHLSLILRRYLEHHPKPRVVVLCNHPCEFSTRWALSSHTTNPELDERFLWCFGSPSETVRPVHKNPFIFYSAEGFRIIAGYLAGGLQHYLNTPNGGQTYGGASANELQEEFIQQAGYVAFRGNLYDSRIPTQEASFYVNSECKQFLADLANYLDKEGILLLVRPTPAIAGFVPPVSEPFAKTLHELERECPNLRIGQPEILLYPRSSFFDALHLNPVGATEFTKQLVDEISRLVSDKSELKP